RIHVAKDNRQAVFAAADHDDLRIRGLRKLKRRLNAAPTQVGLRDALAHDLLKIAYAFCLDLLAFRLSFFALDAKFIFLRNVVLLSFAIMKILVVDDHALIREALHGVLKKLTRDAVI